MIRYPLDKLLLIFYATSVLLFSYAEGKAFITKIAAISLAALFVFRAFRNRGFVTVTREFALVAAWLGYATVSALFAQDQGAALQKLVTLLQIIPASYFVFCVLVCVGSTYSVWAAILAATVGMSILTYLYPETYSVGGRLTALLGNANLYGLALLVAIVIAVHFISVYKNIIVRLFLVSLIPFLFYMLLETGSRKAMVGIVLIAVVVGFAKAKVKFSQNKLAGVGVLALSVLLVASSVYYIMQSTYYHRLESALHAAESQGLSQAELSLRGRIEMYEIGLGLAVDNPVLGVGLNNFRLTKTAERFGGEIGAYSHSNYIEILVSTGFVGFLLYFSVYLSLFLRLLQLRKMKLGRIDKQLYIVTVALLFTFAVYDFAMVSFSEKVSWLILASIMANVYLLSNRTVEASPEGSLGAADPNRYRWNGGVRRRIVDPGTNAQAQGSAGATPKRLV